MKISIIVYFLIISFTIGSWIDVNAIFSQLPLLVTVLPESYELYSFFPLIIQCANITPLIYTIIRQYFPHRVDEKTTIYVILIGCSLCMLILAFVHKIVVITTLGHASSIPLLFIVFCLSSFDTLSTLTFYPYLSLFPANYLSAYFIGQSLSGLIPSVLSLIQHYKTTNTPCSELKYTSQWCGVMNCTNSTTINEGSLFSTQTYFILIFLILCLTVLAFNILNNSKYIATYMSMSYQEFVENKQQKVIETKTSKNFLYDKIDRFYNHLIQMDRFMFLWLSVIFWISFLSNGVITQLMSYTASPYKGMTERLSNNLYLALQAITNLIMLKFDINSKIILTILTIIYTLIFISIFVIAYLAKFDILFPSHYGGIIVILLFCFSGILVASIRLTVGRKLRDNGASAMFLCGLFTQIGSLTGTFIMFIPVSIGCIFRK